MKWVILSIAGIITIIAVAAYAMRSPHTPTQTTFSPLVTQQRVVSSVTPTAIPLPDAVTIPTTYHVYETFNNCGPASLSMALSYFGIEKSQQELGAALRPYQNPKGDNDDKSVTLDELADKAEEFGLMALHRPNGSVDMVKEFIAAGIPVIARTRLKKDDDIGHYRIIKGYDDGVQSFIQDDSFQGKNLQFTYTEFSELWSTFGNEYLVIFPKEKEATVKRIMGSQWDERLAWQSAVQAYIRILTISPDDIYARLNLSVALYHTGDFVGSVSEFEKVEQKLPMRTLWYQIEPILSYYELGNYIRVFEITDAMLNKNNRAFSELYILRGRIYQKQGDREKAKAEFEKAVLYNTAMKEAQDALASIR